MNTQYSNLGPYIQEAAKFRGNHKGKKVLQMIGDIIEAYNPGSAIGELCYIENPVEGKKYLAEVVGFRDDRVLLMALEPIYRVGAECRVFPQQHPPTIHVGDALLGRVLDPLLQPMDGGDPPLCMGEAPLYTSAIPPLERPRIQESLDVGVKAINAVLTCGKGQRVGILAGSGVGKSVLLGMMAKYTSADINVIALIGERGREVKDFIEKNLGEEGLARSVLVVATSDQPPLVRMRGAFVATAIAEHFREQGKDVLLTMDSATRFAMAKREVGLAAGEPPTTRGYPASVFSLLPQLLERVGTSNSGGSITGFYTVLVEGDDMNDPVADAVRAIVDGHIVLSRDIASKGHYPAIDILTSASRVMEDVVGKPLRQMALKLRNVLATYRESEDLINIGAYVSGSNPDIDYAISKYPLIQEFLRQATDESISLVQSEAMLSQIFSD